VLCEPVREPVRELVREPVLCELVREPVLCELVREPVREPVLCEALREQVFYGLGQSSSPSQNSLFNTRLSCTLYFVAQTAS
jgi:hypothetical protein